MDSIRGDEFETKRSAEHTDRFTKKISSDVKNSDDISSVKENDKEISS